MSILQIEQLGHAFGAKVLYQNAALELNRGERMGIVGQNGTGKSTLIRILTGEIVPDAGRILWQGGVRIGYIDQHATLDGEQTLRAYLQTAFQALYDAERELQALYRCMGENPEAELLREASALQTRLEAGDFYSLDSRILRVAEGLGLAALGMERRLSTLSGGQRAKAILGKLLLSAPDVLLLDEPTNFLDTAHVDWLAAYLRAFEGSALLVSHDTVFLNRVVNCVCDIEFQTLTRYVGDHTAFLRQKGDKRRDAQRRYEAQQAEIERLETYIAKNRVRAATAQLAKSRQKRLDRMEKILPPALLSKPNFAFAAAQSVAGKALVVEGLRIGYASPLLPALDFVVEGGQKIAITGRNGIGKSTLLKTLAGRIPALGGRYCWEERARIGYFEQDLVWEDGARTPLEILCAEFPEIPQKRIRRELAHCGISAAHVMQSVRSLSGGEQNKVKLCRFLLRPANVLLLDEPTNHLDAETRAALAEAIRGFAGAVLLVCHESDFYRSIVDRVIDVEKWKGRFVINA